MNVLVKMLSFTCNFSIDDFVDTSPNKRQFKSLNIYTMG